MDDALEVFICSCPGGEYVGARKAGTPFCCERCGFMARIQHEAIVTRAVNDALNEAADAIKIRFNEATKNEPHDQFCLDNEFCSANDIERNGWLSGLLSAVRIVRARTTN